MTRKLRFKNKIEARIYRIKKLFPELVKINKKFRDTYWEFGKYPLDSNTEKNLEYNLEDWCNSLYPRRYWIGKIINLDKLIMDALLQAGARITINLSDFEYGTTKGLSKYKKTSNKPYIYMDPDLPYLVPFQNATYGVGGEKEEETAKFQWLVRLEGYRNNSKIIHHAAGKNSEASIDFHLPGNHTVYCKVTLYNGVTYELKRKQVVKSPKELAHKFFPMYNMKEAVDSAKVHIDKLTYAYNLISEKDYPKIKSEYKKGLEKTKIKLSSILDKSPTFQKQHTIKALLISRFSSIPIPLRLFLKQEGENWTLIDATNPITIREYTGEPDSNSKGVHKKLSAIYNAWKEFLEQNKNPEGYIIAQPPKGLFTNVDRYPDIWEGDSDGESTWGKVAFWLKVAGFILITIGTMGAGSAAYATAFGYITAAGYVLNAAGAIANITDRVKHGHFEWDLKLVMDVLDIFTGFTNMAPGLMTTIKGVNFTKYTLKGQKILLTVHRADVAFEAANGIVLSIKTYTEISKINEKIKMIKKRMNNLKNNPSKKQEIQKLYFEIIELQKKKQQIILSCLAQNSLRIITTKQQIKKQKELKIKIWSNKKIKIDKFGKLTGAQMAEKWGFPEAPSGYIWSKTKNGKLYLKENINFKGKKIKIDIKKFNNNLKIMNQKGLFVKKIKTRKGWFNRVLNYKGSKTIFKNAKPPNSRGMINLHNQLIRNYCIEKKIFLIMRDSNSHATIHLKDVLRKKLRLSPKPMGIKIKSSKRGKNAGLVTFPPPYKPGKKLKEFYDEKMTIDNLPKRIKKEFSISEQKKLLKSLKKQKDYITRYKLYKEHLKDKGFIISNKKNGYVVKTKDKNGNIIDGLFSDYDMHGVYGLINKKWKHLNKGKENALIDDLNKEFDIKMFQHGSQDGWKDATGRKKLGISPPVTAYAPNGKVYSLTTKSQMIKFYKEYLNIDLKELY